MTKLNTQKKFIFICFLLVIVFAINLVLCYLSINNKYTLGVQNFKNSKSQIAYNNNVYKNKTSNTTISKENAIFENSTEAILTSIQKLAQQNEIYYKSLGVITTDALGAKIVVKSQEVGYKFANDEYYQKIEKCQVSGIDMGQTDAREIYSLNNKSFIRNTKNVKISNSELISSFNSGFKECDLLNFEILSYNINKNTIKSANDLVVYYNSDNTINHYAIEFTLNPVTSTTKYAQIIYNEAIDIAKDLPTFYEIKMRMEIDRNGNLTQLSIYEYYLLPVFVSAYVTNEFTYIFKNISDAPNLLKPQI